MSFWRIRPAGAALDRGRHDGFVMVEFLVAFTLLALFLAAIFAQLAVAIRGDHKAAFLSLATLLARSKLAEAGVLEPLAAGVATGTFPNGYRWRTVVRPHGRAEGGPAAAYRIEVTIAEGADPGGRSFTLEGIEIERGIRPQETVSQEKRSEENRRQGARP